MGHTELALPLPVEKQRAVVGTLLALAMVLFVALRLPCINIPLERDEGEYAYFAQRALAGDVPYKDMFNQKPPGTFLVYMLPVSLCGPSVAAIHVTLFLWTALTAIVVYAVARQLAGRIATAFAMPLFAVISQAPVWRATAANTEQFMLLPLTLSVFCALRAMRNERVLWWMASGFMLMSACWFKQIAALYAPLLLILLLASLGRHPMKFIRALFAAMVGLMLAGAPVIAWFITRGAWDEFVDAVWTHNLTYAKSLPWENGKHLLAEEFRNQSPAFWMIWLLAAPSLLDWRGERRRAALPLFGWLIVALAGACIGLRFFSHYFIPSGPPLAMAAGMTLHRIAGRMTAGWNHIGNVLGAAALIFIAMLPQMAHDRQLYRATPAQQAQMLYYDAPFDLSGQIADYMQLRTRPDDRVLIYGSEPQILFLAERVSATRYIIFYPLMIPGEESLRRQEQVWSEISAAWPACILLSESNDSLLETTDSPGLLRRKVLRLVSQEYQLTGLRLGHGYRSQMLFDEAAREAFASADDERRGKMMSFFIFLRKDTE